MRDGLTDTVGSGKRQENIEATIVQSRGREIKTTGAVSGPRFSVLGRIVGNNELPGGMDRVGVEVVRETVQTRPGGEGGVGAPGSHGVKGEFSVGKKAVPEISGEVGMGGGEGGEEMVFAGPH